MFEFEIREIENFFKTIGMNFFKRDINLISVYFFFHCLSIKRKEIFQEILNKNFTLDDFLSFIENDSLFPNPPKEEINLSFYDITTLDLLRLIACILVPENSKNLENEKEKIKNYFGKGMDRKGVYNEPWSICKEINESGKIPY